MKSLGRKPEGTRLERIKASPLWTGERFQNVHLIIPGLRDPNVPMSTIRDFLCGGERRTPLAPLPSMNPLDAWGKPADSGLRATWLGHSTVLIEIDGLRVLTDPVWGLRDSPSSLAGPKRFQPVPVPLRSMPPIDLVIVSHDHHDHLDYPTVRELAKRDVPFETSLGIGAHLEAWGVRPERIVELEWWESHTVPGTRGRQGGARTCVCGGRTGGDRCLRACPGRSISASSAFSRFMKELPPKALTASLVLPRRLGYHGFRSSGIVGRLPARRRSSASKLCSRFGFTTRWEFVLEPT